MPTIITHAFLGLAAAEALRAHGPGKTRLRVLSMACAAAPDLDAAGFLLGIRYADALGHRGLSHSLAFAGAAGLLCAIAGYGRRGGPARVAIRATYFALLTASHGLLDALTNGGLGVAFLAPLDPTRHFLPWRPIVVAPLSVGGWLTGQGARVVASELLVVWLPLVVGMTVLLVLRGVHAARRRLERALESTDVEQPPERRQG